MTDKEKPPFLSGERIDLVPASSEYKELYKKWMNIPEARTYAHNAFPVTKKSIDQWFEPQDQQPPKFISFDMWHKEDNKPIGTVGLNHINWVHRNANIFIRIGETDYWREGFATEAAQMVIDYGFLELDLHKVYAGVHAPNVASWTVAQKKIGLTREGVLKEDVYVNGEYHDVYKFRILRSEWEEMREKDKNNQD